MEMRYILRDREGINTNYELIKNKNYEDEGELFIIDLYQVIVNYNLKGDIGAIGQQFREMYTMTREEYFNALNGANIEFFRYFGINKINLKKKVFRCAKQKKYTKKRESKFKIEEVTKMEIEEYVNANITLKYIAEKYNSTTPTVSRIFRENGIKKKKK